MLEALSQAAGARDERLTRIASRCNLPYDRFKDYLADLRDHGLVEERDSLQLTDLGHEMLDTYRAWREGLREHGLLDEA